jgi:uncharacterized membrane protein
MGNVKVASYVEVGLLLAIATPILADIISGIVQADLAGVLNYIAASTISLSGFFIAFFFLLVPG